MQYYISQEHSGKTVKEFLHGILGCSRAQVTRLKHTPDGILLNEDHVTVRAVLQEGDRLSLSFETMKEEVNPGILPVKGDFQCLFEDDSVLIVSKPPHMPTHPTHGHYTDTLANAVSYYFDEKGIPFLFRAVNRLDRDTSGIVLIAKSGLSAATLSSHLAKGNFKKEYIAVLEGKLENDRGIIQKNIKRYDKSIITRCVCDRREGDTAITEYEVLYRSETTTVVIARPITGRTHQLRVHFAYIGHPILGDSLYGRESPEISRQALHAVFLRFPHPVTNIPMTVYAPPPTDLKHLLPEDLHLESHISETP